MIVGGVTLLDVARRVGCDKSTVSRALRRRVGVAPDTATRICKVAEEMGYRPDPVQVMAAERRWRPGDGIASHAVAFILPAYRGDNPISGLRRRMAQRVVEMARKRLGTLGCSLEAFSREDYPSAEGLARVLEARGIRAVIVPQIPQDEQAYFARFPWSRFTGVGCRMGWTLPPVHIVDSDEKYGVQKAFRMLVERGYRRIGGGLAAHSPWAEDDYSRHGAFAAELEQAGKVLISLPIYAGEVGDKKAFITWFRKVKPDAVIGFHAGMLSWLNEIGVRVPGDVGFVCLHADANMPHMSGLVVDNEHIIRVCMDILVMQIRSNLWGVPALRQRILVEPMWQEGSCIRASSIMGNDSAVSPFA
ncbi:MAG: LacI family DNA-binding transcriptional regulator [Verrucomicrobiota bacterium]